MDTNYEPEFDATWVLQEVANQSETAKLLINSILANARAEYWKKRALEPLEQPVDGDAQA